MSVIADTGLFDVQGLVAVITGGGTGVYDVYTFS
jgi:hypothetical protein